MLLFCSSVVHMHLHTKEGLCGGLVPARFGHGYVFTGTGLLSKEETTQRLIAPLFASKNVFFSEKNIANMVNLTLDE